MSPVFMRVFLVYTGLESFCSILSCAIRDSSLPGYEYIAATAAWKCGLALTLWPARFVQIMKERMCLEYREFSADTVLECVWDLILSVDSWKHTQVKELKMSVHLSGPTSRSWRFNEDQDIQGLPRSSKIFQDLPRSSIHKNYICFSTKEQTPTCARQFCWRVTGKTLKERLTVTNSDLNPRHAPNKQSIRRSARHSCSKNRSKWHAADKHIKIIQWMANLPKPQRISWHPEF